MLLLSHLALTSCLLHTVQTSINSEYAECSRGVAQLSLSICRAYFICYCLSPMPNTAPPRWAALLLGILLLLLGLACLEAFRGSTAHDTYFSECDRDHHQALAGLGRNRDGSTSSSISSSATKIGARAEELWKTGVERRSEVEDVGTSREGFLKALVGVGTGAVAALSCAAQPANALFGERGSMCTI